MMMQMQLTPGYFLRCAERNGCCLVNKTCAALQGEPYIVDEYDNVTVYGVTATTEAGERYLVRFELHGDEECMDYDHPTTVERIPWNYRRAPQNAP